MVFELVEEMIVTLMLNISATASSTGKDRHHHFLGRQSPAIFIFDDHDSRLYCFIMIQLKTMLNCIDNTVFLYEPLTIGRRNSGMRSCPQRVENGLLRRPNSLCRPTRPSPNSTTRRPKEYHKHSSKSEQRGRAKSDCCTDETAGSTEGWEYCAI
jgi:hypothetical protein